MAPEKPSSWKPRQPNILITGTPGTGKTTLSKELASVLGLRHISVSDFAKEHNLLADHNQQQNFHYMHEDDVLDQLEPLMTEGAILLEHHSCDWFPQRWIQMVVVTTATTEALYDRLTARNYVESKVRENVQAEIMMVCKEEAVQSYPDIKLIELDCTLHEMLPRNVETVRKAWRQLNGLDHQIIQ